MNSTFSVYYYCFCFVYLFQDKLEGTVLPNLPLGHLYGQLLCVQVPRRPLS